MTETIHVKGENGAIYQMDLPLPEPISDRLTKGFLKRVNKDGSDYTETPAERPAVNAPKADWIGWAVKNGANPDDAEAATKTDLIEKYGVN